MGELDGEVTMQQDKAGQYRADDRPEGVGRVDSADRLSGSVRLSSSAGDRQRKGGAHAAGRE